MTTPKDLARRIETTLAQWQTTRPTSAEQLRHIGAWQQEAGILALKSEMPALAHLERAAKSLAAQGGGAIAAVKSVASDTAPEATLRDAVKALRGDVAVKASVKFDAESAVYEIGRFWIAAKEIVKYADSNPASGVAWANNLGKRIDDFLRKATPPQRTRSLLNAARRLLASATENNVAQYAVRVVSMLNDAKAAVNAGKSAKVSAQKGVQSSVVSLLNNLRDAYQDSMKGRLTADVLNQIKTMLASLNQSPELKQVAKAPTFIREAHNNVSGALSMLTARDGVAWMPVQRHLAFALKMIRKLAGDMRAAGVRSAKASDAAILVSAKAHGAKYNLPNAIQIFYKMANQAADRLQDGESDLPFFTKVMRLADAIERNTTNSGLKNLVHQAMLKISAGAEALDLDEAPYRAARYAKDLRVLAGRILSFK